MTTRYQMKEHVHNHLRDEFLDAVSSSVLDMVASWRSGAVMSADQVVLLRGIVDSMISWGNRKVERCVMDEIERQQERAAIADRHID